MNLSLYWFKLFFFAYEENSVPNARREEISSKLTSLPSQPPPGQEPQCLKTEGATAKVVILVQALCVPCFVHLSIDVNYHS